MSPTTPPTSRPPHVLLLLCLTTTALLVARATPAVASPTSASHLTAGLAAQSAGDNPGATLLFHSAVSADPLDAAAWALLGLAQAQDGETASGVASLQQAVRLAPHDQQIGFGLTRALSQAGRLDDALEHQLAVVERHDSAQAWRWLGAVLVDMKDFSAALSCFDSSIHREPDPMAAAATALLAAQVMYDMGDGAGCKARLLELVADDAPLMAATDSSVRNNALFLLGTVLLEEERFQDGIDVLAQVPTARAIINRATAHQSLGEQAEALVLYDQALGMYDGELPPDVECVVQGNRGGALFRDHRLEDALSVLGRVVGRLPLCRTARSNLALTYRRRGAESDLQTASTMFQAMAADADTIQERTTAQLRDMLVLPAVMASTDQASRLRARFADTLRRLLASPDVASMRVDSLTADVEWLPFEIVYHGADDDRPLLESFSQLMRVVAQDELIGVLDGVASAVDDDVDPGLVHGTRPVRVVFMSRYFAREHPHALLARPVIQRLDRRYFTPIVVHRHAGIVTDDETLALADEVYLFSGTVAAGQAALAAARGDVIVYLDQLSEPYAYTLALDRFAPVQCVFVGNPTTSGHLHSIDYFLSGDALETPIGSSHYTEQLVRLSGQGTFYDALAVPTTGMGNRAAYGIPDNATTVYGCLQSGFKLHPEFDTVLGDVLRATPGAVMLMVSPRNRNWADQLWARLEAAIPDVVSRVVMAPRANNETAFLRMVSVVSVMLDPFPFGGSKTAIDSLAVGVPVVTWPQQYLRGRAAHTFYDTMGLTSFLAASSRQTYVELAVRLGTDRPLHAKATHAIQRLLDFVWASDASVTDWELLLLTAVGYPLSVRTGVRAKLEALQSDVATRLRARQVEVQAELDAMG